MAVKNAKSIKGEPWLFLHEDGSYHVRVAGYNGKPTATGGVIVNKRIYLPKGIDRHEAVRWRDKMKRDLKNGVFRPDRYGQNESSTLRELAERYIGARLARRTVTPQTAERWKYRAEHWMKIIGQIDPRDIDIHDIEDTEAALRASDISYNEFLRTFTTLKTIIDYAVNSGLRSGNPCRAIEHATPEPVQHARTLTLQEVSLVFDNLRMQDEAAKKKERYLGHEIYFRAMLVLWQRQAETSLLTWAQLKGPDKEIIYRNAKGKKKLLAKMVPAGLFDALTIHRDNLAEFGHAPNQGELEWVFPNSIGEHSTRDTRKKAFRRAIQDAGLVAGHKKGGYVPHNLRRVYIEALRGENVPEEERMALVGHDSVEAHRSYVQANPERSLDLARMMDDAISPDDE